METTGVVEAEEAEATEVVEAEEVETVTAVPVVLEDVHVVVAVTGTYSVTTVKRPELTDEMTTFPVYVLDSTTTVLVDVVVNGQKVVYSVTTPCNVVVAK